MTHTAPTRREFLQAAAATAVTPLVLSAATSAASPTPPRRPWKWAPEPGLWETQCGDDVVAQLHAAADAGFAAFADPELLARSSDQLDALRAVLVQRGIRLGPFRGPTCGYRSFSELVATFRAALTCCASGTRAEVFCSPIEQGREYSQRRRTQSIELMRSFVVRACDAWKDRYPAEEMMPILWEPSRTHFAPGEQALEVFADLIHEVNHPLCRLSADTYRLASAGIDVVDYLHRHAAILGHVELADFPGGYEPGSGTLDIDGIIAATALSPHVGVIGLRCGLSQPGPEALKRLIAAGRKHGGLCEVAGI